MSQNPLGKDIAYPQQYAPGVLHGIARTESRNGLLADQELPFHGEDIWNAWEVSWLNERGKPVAATGEFRVPADSPDLIESKSLKLYLASLATSRFQSTEELADLVSRDLGAVAGAPVTVILARPEDRAAHAVRDLPGACIDDVDGEFCFERVDASLLMAGSGEVREEALHSHLLRSNCPVTGHPDLGSLLVRYRGQQIDRRSLLQYLVSYRQHSDFHEACVERIFMDIRGACRTEKLTVYARYNRRGGLDINPFRSDFEIVAENLRLWRQ